MSTFNDSYEAFKAAWKNQSVKELKKFISKELSAREISGEKIEDYGYDESIEGWTQAFDYFRDKDAKWVLADMGSIPLRDNELMAILYATLEIGGKRMETANLFFHTFRKTSGSEWEMVRSYVEAGITLDKVENLQISR